MSTDGRSDYQVYLGNNRGVFDMGHSWLKRSDPRFWGNSLDSSMSPVDGGAYDSFLSSAAQTTTSKSSRCQSLALAGSCVLHERERQGWNETNPRDV
jgi:hypothetical protein